MTDKEIITALDCLKGELMLCAKCACRLIGYPACQSYAAKDIDKYIKKLKAEIERRAAEEA